MAGLAGFDRDIHNAVSQTLRAGISIMAKKQVGMDSKLLMVL